MKLDIPRSCLSVLSPWLPPWRPRENLSHFLFPISSQEWAEKPVEEEFSEQWLVLGRQVFSRSWSPGSFKKASLAFTSTPAVPPLFCHIGRPCFLIKVLIALASSHGAGELCAHFTDEKN